MTLFDISVDPHLEKDLSLDFPDRAAALRKLLIEWLVEASTNPWVRTSEIDPDVRDEQLAALG